MYRGRGMGSWARGWGNCGWGKFPRKDHWAAQFAQRTPMVQGPPGEQATVFLWHKGARAVRAGAGGGRGSRQSQRAEPDSP